MVISTTVLAPIGMSNIPFDLDLRCSIGRTPTRVPVQVVPSETRVCSVCKKSASVCVAYASHRCAANQTWQSLFVNDSRLARESLREYI